MVKHTNILRGLGASAVIAIATGGLSGCYYGPPVAYCQAPPAQADQQASNVPLQANGTCPQGTAPIYAQAAPAAAPAYYPAPAPAYAYPYPYAYPYGAYPYGYGAYPPVSLGFGFRFR